MGSDSTPPVSPYTLYETTDNSGKVIRFTITFDGSFNLTGATAFRDSACVYRHVYIGLGADGTPDSTPKQFTVPSGTTNITKSQLNNAGLVTADDAINTQITCGP